MRFFSAIAALALYGFGFGVCAQTLPAAVDVEDNKLKPAVCYDDVNGANAIISTAHSAGHRGRDATFFLVKQ